MVQQQTGSDRRARRSTRVSRQLAAARERNNRQLAQIREREVLVEQALRDYVAASEQVMLADQACRDKLAQLGRRIEQTRAEHDAQVAGVRAAQVQAVLTIHEAGRTVKQVAELLELSEKATRQLLKCGRDAGGGSGPAAAGAGASNYRERTPAGGVLSDRDDARQYTTSVTTPPPSASSASTDPTVRN